MIFSTWYTITFYDWKNVWFQLIQHHSSESGVFDHVKAAALGIFFLSGRIKDTMKSLHSAQTVICSSNLMWRVQSVSINPSRERRVQDDSSSIENMTCFSLVVYVNYFRRRERPFHSQVDPIMQLSFPSLPTIIERSYFFGKTDFKIKCLLMML